MRALALRQMKLEPFCRGVRERERKVRVMRASLNVAPPRRQQSAVYVELRHTCVYIRGYVYQQVLTYARSNACA